METSLHQSLSDDLLTAMTLGGLCAIENKEGIREKEDVESLLRSYKRIIEEREEIETVARRHLEKETERVQAWKEKRLEESTYLKMRLEGLLKAYAEEELKKKKGKTKSIKHIHGTLSFRKAQAKYIYDEEALRKSLARYKERFLEAQPPKVNRTKLKEEGFIEGGKVYIDGKLVEGVTVEVPTEDTFFVKV